MANCNKLFLDFDKNISVPTKAIQKMTDSRVALENKIRDHFKKKDGVSAPFFATQGSASAKFRTLIFKSDGSYDADLGVYFKEKPTVEPKTVQGYVVDCVKDHTAGGVEHREKCIRVIYKGDFNVDLPVYYMTDKDSHPYLATKSNGWLESDPKELLDWLKSKKDKNGQLVRVAKYFKAWANNQNFKMPSGIALSVWAAKYHSENDRDDISLHETLKNISDSFFLGVVSCTNPATPGDDLTSKLDVSQKDKFKAELKSLIADAGTALNSKNQLEASKLWIGHLGKKFKLGEDADVDKREQQLRATSATILAEKAKLDTKGIIQDNNGVDHKKHKNFGG